jgi:molybdopterin-guanine dinucleotide biosynthesis protein A
MMSKSSPSNPQLAALILAGGKSSRMGEDKAQILWEGKSLLQRVCEVACHCASQVYYITPWPERYESLLSPEHLSGRTVQALPETEHKKGPLGALWEGLSQIEVEWVLVLACDLPLLDPAIVQQWADQLPNLPPQSLALVPQQGTLWHPMCGFYRQCAVEPLGQFLEEGGRSFQRWLPEIGATPLEVGTAEFRMLRNFNTPGDLHAPSPE